MAKSICGACDQTFTSVSAFDMHRVGGYGDPIYKKGKLVEYGPSKRHCLSAEEMREKGMLQNEKGWWTTGAFYMGQTKPEEIEEEELEEVPESSEVEEIA